MAAWLLTHYFDIIIHLALDLAGGISLRCAMGVCKHKSHQYAVWATFAVLFAIATVAIIG